MAASAFAGKCAGQGYRAQGVDGVFLAIACFAAAVENVGVLGSFLGGEDLREGFCSGKQI